MYHSVYAKTMYHTAKKQVYHRGHNELPLTHKNQDKLDPLGQLIYRSKDAIEGPTKRQVNNEVHRLYGEVLSWIINQLKQTSRGRGKVLLLLEKMKPINKSRDIMQKTIKYSTSRKINSYRHQDAH